MKPLFLLIVPLALASIPATSFAGAAAVPKSKLAEQEQAPTVVKSTADIASDSLIRVNSTNQTYDFFRPWMKKAPYMRRGTGVILADNRVLVTAELVANHSYVELEKPGSAEKCPAEVLVVDYDADLALLKPAREDFLEKSKPLEISSGAKVGDKIEILQLEANGAVARTPGVVTTISVSDYPMDSVGLLSYRLSVPLQSRDGSFTIPAVKDGKLLGLLMRYDSRSQTAELVPPPVIDHFLADAALPQYPGFPRLGISISPTRDPQFRRYIGLKDGGVYVTEVTPGGSAEKAGIKRGDAITSVAGKAIDQDGNYDDPEYGKISFSHLLNTLGRSGETVEIAILRDGKEETIPVVLAPLDHSRVASESYVMDTQPKYFILGGLIFQELSRPYLYEWGGNWRKEAPQRLVYLDAFQNELPKDRGKIVFLSQVLPAESTVGYEDLDHLVVSKINDVPIKSLADIATAAAQPKNGFHKIEFEEDPGVIYLDAGDVQKNTDQIIQHYNLPASNNLDTK